MIPAGVVEEVRRLLAQGRLSQRQIAKRTGVSRGTVAAIASGRRHTSGSRTPLPPEAPPGGYPRGKPVRCPGCGALVQMPCLACWLNIHYRRQ